ncbi:uncharacterized protein TRUGW13939_07846 [Talaromyces rugulosus]|uniref:BTB domain-containing protein n=1 Tax=Talaromyces rugulosus TaxID=121627 RepID=A0A7H8R2U4_TALRU|nr:uncharacterized protein TRUGW13939_07846 [Talaromyces rugulosus]QKX60700.1 hypothetical protein TRUGW13939_07846 [Talaromyces rugulosus]
MYYRPIPISQLFTQNENQVYPQRPASAPPSKSLGDGSEGEAGENLPFVNSLPQTPTRKSKATTTLKATPPETPPAATTTTAKATPTKIHPSGKARNNKRKSVKKQQHEPFHSDYQGSAAAANMQQTPGLLIVDGASWSKNARKDTASDNFRVENPYAGESQAAVKPEPGSKETSHHNNKPYVSPGHGTNPQYAGHQDMPMYMGAQEGYYYNEPLPRQEYPAAFVQHPHAYPVLPQQQGFPPPPPPPPYQPRFEHMRFDPQQRLEQARFEQNQRFDQQRPSPYRGGYSGYQNSKYHHHHNHNHNHNHSHHHQGMGEYRRDEGQYYANHGQSGYSGYTPPKPYHHNAPWSRYRQVSAEHEPVPCRYSPPDPAISPPRNVTAAVMEDAAGFENAAPVVQDGDASVEEKAVGQGVVDTVAEQVDTKPELDATSANVHTKLDTIVKLDVVGGQLDAKPKLGSTAEESTKKIEKPAVNSDSDAPVEDITHKIGVVPKDIPVESDISTVVAAGISNVSPEAIPEEPATTSATAELAAGHDSETETLQESPRAASPGEHVPYQVIQHQESLIVQFATVDMAEALPLANHLVNVFTSRAYGDVEIGLSSSQNKWLTRDFTAHRVIIAQSPVLKSILNRREAMDGKLRIELIAGKRFSMMRSFDCALQNLYGLPLLEFEDIPKHTRLAFSCGGALNVQVPAHVTALEVEFLIGYMAVGAFMSVERIALAGFRIMQDYIHWCSLETFFHFGVWPQDFLIMYAEIDEEPQAKKGGKGNKGKGRKKLGELPSLVEPLNEEVVDNFAPTIATLAAKWLVGNMPTNFTFDQTAYATKLQDRIPGKLLDGPKKSGTPAPAAVELVGLEAGRHEQPTVAHTLISGILLALPFTQLREIVGLLRSENMLTAKLVRNVLEEREHRRILALREYVNNQPNKKVKDVPESHFVLGYREFAVHFEMRDMLDEHMQETRHDFTLHREWVGYQTRGEAQPVLEKFRG